MQVQQSQARNRTEAQVAALTREILAVYDDARRSINKELQRVYATILSGVKPEDYYNTILKYDRLNKLKTEINRLYMQESVKAGRMTLSASRTAMEESFYQNQYVLQWFTPRAGVDLSFAIIPQELVQVSVTGNLASWEKLSAAVKQRIQDTYGSINAYVPEAGSITQLLANNRRDEILKINRAISSGLLRGQSYRGTARDVARVIGTVTPTKSSGAKGSALRVVRTESNRTYNAGAFANTQQAVDQGVEIRRVWLATLDSRTRDTHASLDGQSVAPDKPFTSAGESSMFPGDFPSAGQNINCRCTVIDAVDGVPPQVRRGVNPVTGEREVFDWTTYQEWAKANGVT